MFLESKLEEVPPESMLACLLKHNNFEVVRCFWRAGARPRSHAGGGLPNSSACVEGGTMASPLKENHGLLHHRMVFGYEAGS